MAPHTYYYYFVGPAAAAVLLLVLNAVSILCSASVKDWAVACRMRREKFRWVAVKRYEEGREEECSVCLSAFTEAQQLRQLRHCGHCFHAACIDRWLVAHCTCPICRDDVLRSGEKMKGGDGFNNVDRNKL